MLNRLQRLSLLWKVLLCTSIATTLVIGFAAWRINQYALSVTEQSVEAEIQASLHQYEYLWRSKADNLARLTMLLSTMRDVRAAFSTGDQATIHDTAQELWERISDQQAIFLVLDPQGEEIASLGGPARPPSTLKTLLPGLMRHFPNQARSFVRDGDKLYYLVLTPVYVQSQRGHALLDVLAAGFAIDQSLALELKQATKGSEFAFVSGDRILASTLAGFEITNASHRLNRGRVVIGGLEYNELSSPLQDDSGRTVGELTILRSFELSRSRFKSLQWNITLLWAVALAGALALSTVLAGQVVKPIRALDRAVLEIANRNYDYRVNLHGEDEFGRLAQTFNSMCDSIQLSREELIYQERLNTVGRFSSSFVHDMRNPLAAIYSGAEMLVDSRGMEPAQSRRLAINIYKASRRIQEMLQDLTQRLSGHPEPVAVCRLEEVLQTCVEIVSPVAISRQIQITVHAPVDLKLSAQRGRLERVFLNLVNNAMEAIGEGGRVDINAQIDGDYVVITVDDDGPGIAEDVRKKLFLPFVTGGKRQGLGLGLALSRETVLSAGGDLCAVDKPGRGARFSIRLPLDVNGAQRMGTHRESSSVLE
jgi:signal transduction histidine kinase